MSIKREILPGDILMATQADGSEGQLSLKVQAFTEEGKLVVSPLENRWRKRKCPIILDPSVIGTGEVVDGGRVGRFSFPQPGELTESE